MKLENIKIVAQKGRPKAVFKFSLLSANEVTGYYSYKRMRKHIRTTYTNEYRYIEMSVGDLEDFVDINERTCGKTEDIVFDKESITTYYGFEAGQKMVYRTILTKAFIQKWANLDCPNLIRFTVNVDRKCNWAGLNFLTFEDILYSDDGYGVSVGELTEEEYKAFKSALEPTSYCMEKIAQAYQNQNSTMDIALVEQQVADYESKIQELINTHRAKLEKRREHLPEMPLDCGFMMIFSRNKDINDKISLLKSKGKRTVDYLKLDFPEDCQSVTNSAILFKLFKEFANCPPLTDELFVRTMLD